MAVYTIIKEYWKDSAPYRYGETHRDQMRFTNVVEAINWMVKVNHDDKTPFRVRGISTKLNDKNELKFHHVQS